MNYSDSMRLATLIGELIDLIERKCPDCTMADFQIALSALAQVMAGIMAQLGTDNMPLVESICDEFGAELLGKIKGMHSRAALAEMPAEGRC